MVLLQPFASSKVLMAGNLSTLKLLKLCEKPSLLRRLLVKEQFGHNLFTLSPEGWGATTIQCIQ